jgi:hypothetical protein
MRCFPLFLILLALISSTLGSTITDTPAGVLKPKVLSVSHGESCLLWSTGSCVKSAPVLRPAPSRLGAQFCPLLDLCVCIRPVSVLHAFQLTGHPGTMGLIRQFSTRFHSFQRKESFDIATRPFWRNESMLRLGLASLFVSQITAPSHRKSLQSVLDYLHYCFRAYSNGLHTIRLSGLTSIIIIHHNLTVVCNRLKLVSRDCGQFSWSLEDVLSRQRRSRLHSARMHQQILRKFRSSFRVKKWIRKKHEIRWHAAVSFALRPKGLLLSRHFRRLFRFENRFNFMNNVLYLEELRHHRQIWNACVDRPVNDTLSMLDFLTVRTDDSPQLDDFERPNDSNPLLTSVHALVSSDISDHRDNASSPSECDTLPIAHLQPQASTGASGGNSPVGTCSPVSHLASHPSGHHLPLLAGGDGSLPKVDDGALRDDSHPQLCPADVLQDDGALRDDTHPQLCSSSHRVRPHVATSCSVSRPERQDSPEFRLDFEEWFATLNVKSYLSPIDLSLDNDDISYDDEGDLPDTLSQLHLETCLVCSPVGTCSPVSTSQPSVLHLLFRAYVL